MTFTPETDTRIVELGGTVAECAGSLEERLCSVDFSAVFGGGRLLFDDWADYAELDIFDAVAASPERARELVRYPELEWNVRLFTPFTAGTPDHNEWSSVIAPDAVTALCGINVPTILFIGESDGWPNHYFVVAEDSEPANPTVFTTDHEAYFDEVEELGPLSVLLDSLLTPEEFEATVHDAAQA